MSDATPAAPAAPAPTPARAARRSVPDAFQANDRGVLTATLAPPAARRPARRPPTRFGRLSQAHLSCVLKSFALSLAKTAGRTQFRSASERFDANNSLFIA